MRNQSVKARRTEPSTRAATTVATKKKATNNMAMRWHRRPRLRWPHDQWKRQCTLAMVRWQRRRFWWRKAGLKLGWINITCLIFVYYFSFCTSDHFIKPATTSICWDWQPRAQPHHRGQVHDGIHWVPSGAERTPAGYNSAVHQVSLRHESLG